MAGLTITLGIAAVLLLKFLKQILHRYLKYHYNRGIDRTSSSLLVINVDSNI
jgi:hypothetical protein